MLFRSKSLSNYWRRGMKNICLWMAVINLVFGIVFYTPKGLLINVYCALFNIFLQLAINKKYEKLQSRRP